jgi:glyoxylase-like metal-dependent hydrolase (beta-lactamase superfamily II)
MAQYQILVKGYAKLEGAGFVASPTTVLIKENGYNILADPGCNETLLLEALAREGLKVTDIDMIYLTHTHLDHLLNIRLFPSLPVYEGNLRYEGDVMTPHNGLITGISLRIIQTPGHTLEHTSLLFESDGKKVCLAGDLFWWEEGKTVEADRETLLGLPDPLQTTDSDALLASRKAVLAWADIIIPGHGEVLSL